MKDYKRVTIRHEDGSHGFMYDYNATTPPIKILLDRLAELEDKNEDGTLIELPRNKIKIRDDKDADWNSQNFPKGSGGPYDYDYKGEEWMKCKFYSE